MYSMQQFKSSQFCSDYYASYIQKPPLSSLLPLIYIFSHRFYIISHSVKLIITLCVGGSIMQLLWINPVRGVIFLTNFLTKCYKSLIIGNKK